jgi:hypothetical protein
MIIEKLTTFAGNQKHRTRKKQHEKNCFHNPR